MRNVKIDEKGLFYKGNPKLQERTHGQKINYASVSYRLLEVSSFIVSLYVHRELPIPLRCTREARIHLLRTVAHCRSPGCFVVIARCPEHKRKITVYCIFI